MRSLSIVAAGLASSLGLGSEQACASARAGLARVTPIDVLNTAMDPAFARETMDGVPLFVGHQVPAIAAGFSGFGKLLMLAKSALSEVLRKSGLGADELTRTGFCLVLSDDFFLSRYGLAPDTAEPFPAPGDKGLLDARAINLGERLCQDAGLPIPASSRWVSRAGRLGLLGALNQASTWIAQGRLDRCLIGAVDSLIEPAVLQACAKARVLKTEANPVGFMPGEAAVFLLLEQAGRHGCEVDVVNSSYAVDVPYLDPQVQPLGQGLMDVVQAVLGEPMDRQGELPGLIVSDLNGTEFRAMDWGHAQVRCREALGEWDARLLLPVESFGETGAVSGLLALCMVYEAVQRGQMHSGQVLVLLSAEQGGRGSLLLQTRCAAH